MGNVPGVGTSIGNSLGLCGLALEWPDPLGIRPWSGQFHGKSVRAVALRCSIPCGVCLGSGLGTAHLSGETGPWSCKFHSEPLGDVPGVGASIGNFLGLWGFRGWPWSGQFHWESPWVVEPWSGQFHGKSVRAVAPGWSIPWGSAWATGLGIANSCTEGGTMELPCGPPLGNVLGVGTSIGNSLGLWGLALEWPVPLGIPVGSGAVALAWPI